MVLRFTWSIGDPWLITSKFQIEFSYRWSSIPAFTSAPSGLIWTMLRHVWNFWPNFIRTYLWLGQGGIIGGSGVLQCSIKKYLPCLPTNSPIYLQIVIIYKSSSTGRSDAIVQQPISSYTRHTINLITHCSIMLEYAVVTMPVSVLFPPPHLTYQ